jgi:DNA-binding GntR family transcriptional regulator
MVATMTEPLDLYAGVPMYRQIADRIEAEIRTGQWEPGHPIPSRKTLAQRFDVAGETARRAQLRLAERGYVVGVPGIGAVVTPRDRWPETP